jgi:hypothetical protein
VVIFLVAVIAIKASRRVGFADDGFPSIALAERKQNANLPQKRVWATTFGSELRISQK